MSKYPVDIVEIPKSRLDAALGDGRHQAAARGLIGNLVAGHFFGAWRLHFGECWFLWHRQRSSGAVEKDPTLDGEVWPLPSTEPSIHVHVGRRDDGEDLCSLISPHHLHAINQIADCDASADGGSHP